MTASKIQLHATGRCRFFPYRPLAVASLVGGLLATFAHCDVVLNEVMADNQNAIENGPDFPDYVELINHAGQPVSLANWSLTDDPAQPRRFVFPAGTTLAAGGRLIVWCDVNVGSPGLHSGFGLGSAGDVVRLYAADGATIVDELVFGLQIPNFSLGRVPDGSGSWVLTQPTPLAANAVQPLAENAVLRINEWMARPAVGEDWLEVYNPETLPASVGGFVLTDRVSGTPSNRAIPALSFIAARGYRQFFASDLQRPDADHLDFKLGAGGETLSLYAADRATIMDRVVFGDQTDNVSQGRVPDGGDTFASFPVPSPGQPNAAEGAGVVINEVLTHTDPPLEDAIELHNPTAQPADISHWWLSDSLSQPRKYRIAAGTVIPAGGFAVFYHYQFGAGASGFSLNSFQGDNVVLSAGDAAGNLTGQQTVVTFGALKNGVSIGRVPTSTGVDFVPLAARTFGQDVAPSVSQFRLGTGRTNAAPRVGPMVISEVHFQPVTANAITDEFIELHNPTGSSVPLFDLNAPASVWRLRDGVTFDFPFNVQVPAGGFVLVVGFDPQDTTQLAAFRSRLGVPVNVPVFGPFSGRLSDTGEAVELQHPDEPEGPDSSNPGFVPYELLDRIKYAPAAPWPIGAAGTGQSLQRQDALVYGNESLNWFTAPPTPGRVNATNPDTDGDGLPDTWEQANGLNPNDPADANLDSDGDKQANRDEFIAGTNPQDAGSVFRITALSVAVADWQVTFPAVAGRSYTVEFRDPVASSQWQTLVAIPAGDVTGPRSANFTAPQADSGILRMTVSVEP
jgi:hypothetical protein